MKVMGHILKQCGAFFLHRGEGSQDVVYRSVLNTYVKHLITCESSPLQFFIEGTRSRSNKSISPKFGILKCIVNTLLKNEVEDIMIIPISINYDYLLEDKLFSCELLGIPKPQETTMRLIKSIKNMDDHYGNIYVNFASPLSLRKYIDDINSNKNKDVNLISSLAYEIIYRQQHGMVLSYFNILAVALSYNFFNNMTYSTHLDVIVVQIMWISKLFKRCGAQIEVGDSNIESRIIEAIQIHHNFVTINNKIIKLKNNSFIYEDNFELNSSENVNNKTEKIDRDDEFSLILTQLYVNPSLHFIIDTAFIILVSNCQITWKNDILGLKEKFILLRRLFEFEFLFFCEWENKDFINNFPNYMHISEKERDLLRCLAINPYVKCYGHIYNSLININEDTIPENLIFKSVYKDIKKSHTHPYGLSKDLIKAALNSLQKMEIIEMAKKDEIVQYKINKTIILELVQIFNDLIMSGNDLLKSKI